MSYSFNQQQYHLASTYRKESPEHLALKLSNMPIDERKFIINQVNGYRKSLEKLPFLSSLEFVYADPISLEQASSEQTAKYKAINFAQGKVLDLSGGMGVDSWFFAEHADLVVHIEINELLHQITADNFIRLGKHNVSCIHSSAEEYISKATETFDLIFIDPSRRRDGKRLYDINDCEPNVLELLPTLLKKSKSIVIKASPLLDISATLTSLEYVHEVHIVSVNNECKEVLYFLTSERCHRPKYVAVELNKPKKYVEEFYWEEEASSKVFFGTNGKYLYEPGSSILKSGMFKLIAAKFGLKKIATHSHLYVSDQLIVEFPGKIWTITHRYKKIKQLKEVQLTHVNFITRNAGYSTSELYKLSKLKEGGKSFIFATRDNQDSLLLIECSRVNPEPG